MNLYQQWLLILGIIFCTSLLLPQAEAVREGFSEEEVSQFFKQGYVIVPKLFNDEEVMRISNKADYLQQRAEDISKNLPENEVVKLDHLGTQFVLSKKGNSFSIHRLVWVGAAEPELLSYGRKKSLTLRVSQLLGSDKADHLINQLHYKIPGDKVKFGCHQDIKNRRFFDPDWQDINGTGSFVQVIAAIDSMTPDNGPLKIISGVPKEGDLFLDQIKDPKELEKKIGADQAFSLNLNPGDAVFMHPYLVHGSEPNTSTDLQNRRRVFINGFSYPGANKKPYPGEGSSQEINLR